MEHARRQGAAGGLDHGRVVVIADPHAAHQVGGEADNEFISTGLTDPDGPRRIDITNSSLVTPFAAPAAPAATPSATPSASAPAAATPSPSASAQAAAESAVTGSQNGPTAAVAGALVLAGVGASCSPVVAAAPDACEQH